MTILYAPTKLIFIIWLMLLSLTAYAETGSDFRPVQLKAECRHIKILDPDVAAHHELVPEDLRYQDEEKKKSNLLKPRKYQKKVIHLALNTLSEFVCRSVRAIALYKKISNKKSFMGAYAWVDDDYPSLINIDSDQFREGVLDPNFPGAKDTEGHYSIKYVIAIARISHEAFHCAANLLDTQETWWQRNPLGIDPEDHWSAQTIAKAKKIADKARLQDGFSDIWAEMHEDAVDDVGVEDYIPGRLEHHFDRSPSPGFMTYYAQRTVREDIAETGMAVVMDSLIFDEKFLDPNDKFQPPLELRRGWWVRPCKVFSESIKESIKEKEAVLFSKLSFLKDVEFYDQKALDKCKNNSRKGVNKKSGQRTGFHFYNYKTGQYEKSYTDGFSITRSESGALRIKARGSFTKDGKTLDSFLEMRFNTTGKNLPRGYYKMSWNGSIRNPGPEFDACNHLFFKVPRGSFFNYSQQVPGDKSQSFCAIDARVLVTHATEDHIELSLVLFKVVRTTPRRKTPYVFDPPLQVIIKWKRNWAEDEPEEESPPLVSEVRPPRSGSRFRSSGGSRP